MKNKKNLEIKISKNIYDAKEVRKKVFQIEQGIDTKIDFDGLDKISEHVIAYSNNELVGTMRIRYIEKGKVAKIERMAVLFKARNQKIGTKMMSYALEYLQGKNIEKVMIHSQKTAEKFYKSFQFKAVGTDFEEAGIHHIKMVKILDTENII